MRVCYNTLTCTFSSICRRILRRDIIIIPHHINRSHQVSSGMMSATRVSHLNPSRSDIKIISREQHQKTSSNCCIILTMSPWVLYSDLIIDLNTLAPTCNLLPLEMTLGLQRVTQKLAISQVMLIFKKQVLAVLFTAEAMPGCVH